MTTSKATLKSSYFYLTAGFILMWFSAQSTSCFRLRKTERREGRGHRTGVQEGVILFGRAFEKGMESQVVNWAKKASANSSEEDDSAYQADSPVIPNKGSGQDDGSQVNAWTKMSPTVTCASDNMKLTAAGPGSSLFAVEHGNQAPAMPLSRVPTRCGYNTQKNALALVLAVPYNGCNVVQEGGSYVLPMRWLGIPVSLWCPITAASAQPSAESQNPVQVPQKVVVSQQQNPVLPSVTQAPQMPQKFVVPQLPNPMFPSVTQAPQMPQRFVVPQLPNPMFPSVTQAPQMPQKFVVPQLPNPMFPSVTQAPQMPQKFVVPQLPNPMFPSPTQAPQMHQKFVVPQLPNPMFPSPTQAPQMHQKFVVPQLQNPMFLSPTQAPQVAQKFVMPQASPYQAFWMPSQYPQQNIAPAPTKAPVVWPIGIPYPIPLPENQAKLPAATGAPMINWPMPYNLFANEPVPQSSQMQQFLPFQQFPQFSQSPQTQQAFQLPAKFSYFPQGNVSPKFPNPFDPTTLPTTTTTSPPTTTTTVAPTTAKVVPLPNIPGLYPVPNYYAHNHPHSHSNFPYGYPFAHQGR